MRIIAVVLGALSAFFLAYSVRLFVVTRFLQAIPEGGQGARLGAVVFPVMTIVFALAARWCWRRGRVVVT